jgi:hypothetical protein
VSGTLLEAPEAVDPAGLQPAVDLLPLLRQKTADLPVLLGTRQIDLTVGGVEVAHHQDPAAPLAQSLYALEERPVEVELEGDAAVVTVLSVAVGEIDIGDDQAPEARHLEPPLLVEAGSAQLGLDSIRCSAGVEADAAVARPPGWREVAVPSLGFAHAFGELLAPRANLLDPDDLGAAAVQPLAEALLRAGAQSVHVPAEDPRTLRPHASRSR